MIAFTVKKTVHVDSGCADLLMQNAKDSLKRAIKIYPTKRSTGSTTCSNAQKQVKKKQLDHH